MIQDATKALQNFFYAVLQMDKDLFHKINQVWINPVFDNFFKWITDLNETKYILVLFGLILVYNMKLKSVVVIVGCALSVLVADVTAARIIKPLVQRQRPEYTEYLPRVIVPPQSSYSFPSNHAANAFAAATFLGLTVMGMGPIAVVIACLIGYSRVYVGVHFPLDVIGGAILGTLSAFLVYYLFMGIENVLFPKSIRLPKPWRKKKYRGQTANAD